MASNNINHVNISGNITRDAELQSTAAGTLVLNFSVAVNEQHKNSQTGEWEDYANFFDCTMFGARAKALHQYLTKGTKVAIDGKLRWSQWEKDGQRRSHVGIIVDGIEFLSARNQDQSASQHVQQPQTYDVDSDGMAYEDIPF